MVPEYLIDDVDFTSFIAAGKLKWKRHDLEDASAGRAMDLLMYRKRLGRKRTLAATCRTLSFPEIQRLCKALNPEYIKVTYLDPELGRVTKTFYGTEISSTTMACINGETYFEGTQFELVER